MSLISLTSGGSRKENIRKALGGLDLGEFRKARRILVKPNFTAHTTQLANTHPEAIEAVLEFLSDLGELDITIGDGSGSAYYSGRTMADVFRRFGVDEIARRFGAKLLDLNVQEDYIPMRVKLCGGEGEVHLAKEFFDYDCRISLALPKTHDYALATLSMKNAMCVPHPEDREKVHGIGRDADYANYGRCVQLIHQNLAELFKIATFNLAIIDGYVGMEGNGPISGTPVECGWCIASTDPILADCVGTKLMGLNLEEIGYIHYLLKEREVKIPAEIEAQIPKLAKKFRLHRLGEAQRRWQE